MKVLDVYNKYNIQITDGLDCHVWDKDGTRYLDLYGGHAVISAGHAHPRFVSAMSRQMSRLMFYSNAVENPLQEQYAQKLAKSAKIYDYQLFMCNSGAEANENALKIAAMTTGRKKILALRSAFHGRTAAAVACTDNPRVQSSLSEHVAVDFVPINDDQALKTALETRQYAALIIEPIQGVGGLDACNTNFLNKASLLTKQHGTLFIADEIQSGAGRTGNYFAFQEADTCVPDLITMAKGIGNGFPVGAVLIKNDINVAKGMLGTTFGGNHLACAATTAVLEITDAEQLIDNSCEIEKQFRSFARDLQLPTPKGRGAMLGLRFDFPVAELRKKLLMEHQIFTGAASDANVLRILPPLTLKKKHLEQFFSALEKEMKNELAYEKA